MRQALAFEELLDEHLKGGPGDARPMPGSARAGTATAFGFFFGGVPCGSSELPAGPTRRGVEAATIRTGSFSAAAAASIQTDPPRLFRAAPVPAACSTRPAEAAARRLSARERQAFDDLNRLGARLDAGFTFDELRSVFRALALTYHPDRHADCPEHDKPRLAQLFTRAHDAYRVLVQGCTTTRH